MKRIVLFFTTLLLSINMCFSLTTNWTGTAGDGDWSNAANWDNGVPGVNDEAAFNIDATITSATGTPQISRLFIFGGSARMIVLNINLDINGKGIADRAVQVNAGQLTLGAGFTFNIEGATGQDGIYTNNSNALLTNNGTVTVTVTDDDGINLNSGNIVNNGTLTINGGVNDQRLLLINNGTLTNNATFTLTGGKQFSRGQINDVGTFINAKGATLDSEDGRIKVNTTGTFTNNGYFTSTISTPLRADVGGGANITNNAFFKYSSSANVFVDDGSIEVGTDNGIDLNDVTENTIDFGTSCTADIAQVDYEWFSGATSAGTATATGSLTLTAGTLPADPTTISPDGLAAVVITIQNFCLAALPIDLISFDAKLRNESVMIFWQTASELNNDYMVVEHSMNGDDFEEVGRVAGAGTSNDLNNYELEHKNPKTGFNYYRLRQVDFDGKMEYSKIVQVKLNFQDAPIRVYPTVVENELTIDFSNLDLEKINIQVLNMSGQVLKNIENESNINVLLQMSQLNSGMYLIRISGNGLTTQTHRFIKK